MSDGSPPEQPETPAERIGRRVVLSIYWAALALLGCGGLVIAWAAYWWAYYHFIDRCNP